MARTPRALASTRVAARVREAASPPRRTAREMLRERVYALGHVEQHVDAIDVAGTNSFGYRYGGVVDNVDGAVGEDSFSGDRTRGAQHDRACRHGQLHRVRANASAGADDEHCLALQLSPTPNQLTDPPTAATSPAASLPMTIGNTAGMSSRTAPSANFQSMGLRPATSTRTRIWPDVASGIGSSATRKGPP